MANKKSLNDLWLLEWGDLEESESLLDREVDTTKPPALWPMSRRDDVRIAPILNNGQWFTLVKAAHEQALTDRQKEALLVQGFRAGSEGRFINPAYPTPHLMHSLSLMLGAPLEPLAGEDVVTLKKGDHFSPTIPLEVQSGVRWLWKHRPNTLREEILVTLSENDGNLPENLQALLDQCPITENGSRAPSQKFLNPVRLQNWVSDAFGGEVNEVTESILSLGLYRGTQVYGPHVADWPEHLQEFHTKLASFRGDAVNTSVSEKLWLTASESDNDRPAIGQKLSWLDDNTRKTGVVVGHPEDTSGLWVSPDKLVQSNDKEMFYFPVRQLIPVSSISSNSKPAEEPKTAEAESPSSNSDAEPRAAVTNLPDLEAQAAITASDLTFSQARELERTHTIDPALEAQILSFLNAGRLYGLNPLNTPRRAAGSAIMVGQWRELNEAFYGYTDYREAMEDGEAFVRDAMLDTFNLAQPESPGGSRLPLAVLPAGHGLSEFAGNTNPEVTSLLDTIQFCRVGIHPMLMPSVFENLGKWEDRARGSGMSEKVIDDLNKSVQSLGGANMTLSNCAFGASERVLSTAVHKNFERVMEEVTAAHDGQTLDERKRSALKKFMEPGNIEKIRLELGDSIFTSLSSAQEIASGTSVKLQTLTAKNRLRLDALADLANISKESVEAIDHPAFVILDTLAENGLSCVDRAEGLARLNVDLTQKAHWLGQMAMLAGISVEAVEAKHVYEPLTENQKTYAEGLFSPNATILRNGAKRACIYTGLIQRDEKTHPFQVALIAEKDDLINHAFTHRLSQSDLVSGDWIGNHDQLSSSSRGSPTPSLGRLIDLHAINPLKLGAPLAEGGQLLTQENKDAMEVSTYGIDYLTGLSVTPTPWQATLSAYESGKSIERLPEMVGQVTSASIIQKARESRDHLLDITPAWRLNSDRSKMIKDAMELWILDFKPTSRWSRTENLVNDIYSDLKNSPNAEILVFTGKTVQRRTSLSLKFQHALVTTQDIEKAGGDREVAAEQAILKIKERYRELRKGFKFTTFDTAKILRPEALRYLKEQREELRRKLAGPENETDEPTRRGARQDKGMVAGLAAKDLRGKISDVLLTLNNATAEDQARFITKIKLWETPDWVFLQSPSDDDMNEGARPMEPVVAAFFDEVRTRILPSPPANTPDINKAYAKLVLGVRAEFDKVRTREELITSLESEDGGLRKTHEEARNTAEAMDVSTGILFGEMVVNDTYYRAPMPFSSIFNKAAHRSNANTHWDIKAKKGGYRPTNQGEDRPQTGAMPMLSKLVRTGAKDYRAGLDVSEETVLTTFGFSGIEYGNSMTQKDRETYLNEAYDGFMDLSSVLKVQPRALSLGGTLGLAFGSRGRGGRNAALAHFEPANNAINLTRMKGAGSMAHEYGHAFANYLYRLSRGVPGSRAPGDITTSINQQMERGSDTVMGGNLRQVVADAVADVLRNIRYLPTTPEDMPKPSEFIKGAGRADVADGRRIDSPYWKTIEELFARSFETYIDAALKAQNPDYRNDFLVREDKLALWGTGAKNIRAEAYEAEEKLNQLKVGDITLPLKGGETPEQIENLHMKMVRGRRNELRQRQKMPQLYPEGQELQGITKAFNYLFDTLETKEQTVKHDHLGMISLPILYSHSTGSIARVSEREHNILAHCVLEEVARMCGPEVWVSWQDSMTDSDGHAVAGRYRDHTSKAGQVRSVIELAYGASIGTAYHEAFHFAQSHLLTNNERRMMDNQFAPDSDLNRRVVAMLIEEGNPEAASAAATNTREAQAYGYEQWVKGNLEVKPAERPISVYGRIKAFFSKALGLGTNAGFNTPQALFSAFHRGRIADRAAMEQKADTKQSESNGNDLITKPLRPTYAESPPDNATLAGHQNQMAHPHESGDRGMPSVTDQNQGQPEPFSDEPEPGPQPYC